MNDVLAMILAGGQGDRLSILSEQRAKPAVVFGGNYRIIDFVLSNCANSDISKLAVLTQYRPRSLFNHLGAGRPWGYDTHVPLAFLGSGIRAGRFNDSVAPPAMAATLARLLGIDPPEACSHPAAAAALPNGGTLPD